MNKFGAWNHQKSLNLIWTTNAKEFEVFEDKEDVGKTPRPSVVCLEQE
jgi:hypothetical protein